MGVPVQENQGFQRESVTEPAEDAGHLLALPWLRAITASLQRFLVRLQGEVRDDSVENQATTERETVNYNPDDYADRVYREAA